MNVSRIHIVLLGTMDINKSELRDSGYLILIHRIVAARIADVAGSNPSWFQDYL